MIINYGNYVDRPDALSFRSISQYMDRFKVFNTFSPPKFDAEYQKILLQTPHFPFGMSCQFSTGSDPAT